MALDDILLLAAWTILFVIMLATLPRLLPQRRLDRPKPLPLEYDDAFDVDGPVIDMEPA